MAEQVIHVIHHDISPDERALNEGDARLYYLAPDWAPSEPVYHGRLVDPHGKPRFSLSGRCNDTHRVVYSTVNASNRALASALHVYQAWSNDLEAEIRLPRLPHGGFATTNLLHTMEMTPHIGFASAEGFVGTVALDKDSPNALVWRPVNDPRR
eukprot:5205290-Prymnesium_polylepis.1